MYPNSAKLNLNIVHVFGFLIGEAAQHLRTLRDRFKTIRISKQETQVTQRPAIIPTDRCTAKP
jgi:hypothetical protein